MPDTVTPPTEPTIDNPVIKPGQFDDAKAVFRQTREKMGLDKPAEEPVSSEPDTQTQEPTQKETDAKPSDDAPKPASVLPDDVLEPKKEEPKKSELISEIESLELPEGAKPKARGDFAKLKTKAIENLSKAEARVQELETKLSQARSQTEIDKIQEKLTAAEKRAAEIEDQWAKTSLETSPQFQRQFIAREQAELDSAKSYLEGTEVDPRIIEFAARNQGVKRLNILTEAGLDPAQIAAIEARLSNFDTIQRDKSAAVENWRAQGAAWQEEAQRQQEAMVQKNTERQNKVWDAVLSKNVTNLLPLRESKDETWNSLRNEIIERSKDAFNGNGIPEQEIADRFQKGFAYDALEGITNKLVEELKAVRSENAKLKSAAPGGVITQSTTTAPAMDTSKMSREELSKNTFNEQMAKARGG